MNYQQISNQTGDWLLDTVQRKPEALLLIAAGCALLMRSGGSLTGIWSSRESNSPALSKIVQPWPAGWQTAVVVAMHRRSQTLSRNTVITPVKRSQIMRRARGVGSRTVQTG